MEGYHRLCCLIGHYPEFAIFRRFRRLCALNAVVIQQEIVNLEHSLGFAVNTELAIASQKNRTPVHYSVLKLAHKAADGGQDAQYDLMLQLRSKLREFDEAISLYKRFNNLPAARPVNVLSLKAWLTDKRGGNDFLKGYERKTWDEEDDLTSLLEPGDGDDPISRWISDRFLPWFHEKIWHVFRSNELPLWNPTITDKTVFAPVDIYADSTVRAMVTGLSTILSSLLPCCSMFLLYYVHPPVVRLSIILALSLMFSIAMALIAEAKRETCFAATSAFAAVLVVFVGSTNTGGGQTN